MTPPVLTSIVEGQGEEEAFPKLIYRVAAAIQAEVHPIIRPPFRVRRDALKNRQGALEEYAVKAFLEGGPTARLIILLDAEDDPFEELGQQLLQRVPSHIPRDRVSVSIANREYESWFIASLESIAPLAGINETTPVPQNIENIRGAKEWLSRRMARGEPYKPTLHQADFSSAVDIDLARQRSPSFDRFCREVERLLSA